MRLLVFISAYTYAVGGIIYIKYLKKYKFIKNQCKFYEKRE